VRLAFLGSPDYAVPSLEALAASRHSVVAVVTQPAREAGRGRKARPTAVAEAAARLGLPVIETANVNSRKTRDALAAAAPDALVVVAFGQMLRRKVLDLAPRGAINAHGSLLPRHRGASPIAAAILAGDDVTGVTIMRMVRRMDAGPVIARESVALAGNETAGELHDSLAGVSARMLPAALDEVESGAARESPQDESAATYCWTMTKEDGRLDFSEPAETLERRVRAYHPWPGAYAELQTERGELRVTVTAAAVSPDEGPRGEVLAASGDELVVACGRGSLRILRLKPAGSREMTAAEFLRGRTVTLGARGGREKP
jgi:methionyl-tRNA formyltransferase